MQSRVNEAEGQAEALLSIAKATADSIKKVAVVIGQPGGDDAIRLQMIERYLDSLSKLADPRVSILLPADLSNFESLMGAAGLEKR